MVGGVVVEDGVEVVVILTVEVGGGCERVDDRGGVCDTVEDVDEGGRCETVDVEGGGWETVDGECGGCEIVDDGGGGCETVDDEGGGYETVDGVDCGGLVDGGCVTDDDVG